MYNLQATLREITVLDLPVTEITVEVVDLPLFLDMTTTEDDGLDFGPSEPFAPYSEVHFLTSEILPYGTRFGIPYFKEEVRHRHHLVKGATRWSEPSPEDDLPDF